MVLAYLPQRMKQSLVINSNYPPQGVLVDGVVPPVEGGPLLAIYPPIADNTFQFYKFYQIKKNQVPTTQTDRPIAIVDTLGAGILQETSGFDVRVFDSAGNPIEYDRVLSTIGTGDIIIWINPASVQDNEFVQLTFGKPTATDGSNSAAVWNNNIVTYHLNQTTFGANSTKDSTGNSIDGTPINMDNTNIAVGKIGSAIVFDGIDELIELIPSTLLNNLSNGFMISCWVKQSVVSGTNRMFSTVAGEGVGFAGVNSLTQLQFTTQGIKDYNQTISSVTLGIFHHILVHMKTDNDVDFYFDGEFIGTVIGASPAIAGTGVYHIGAQTPSAFHFAGTLDQLEVITTIPSNVADAVKTMFNNQNDQDAFWFKTPLLENGEDNFLVDDQGRNIVAVQA